MRCDCKRQPHVHAAAISFDGCVNEFLDFGEGDDLIKLPLDLFPRHAEDRSVEKDVLASTQFGMKPRADFEQTRHATKQFNPANGWFDNTRKNLEQRRFAGTVTPDDAYDLTRRDLKIDVCERPDGRGVAVLPQRAHGLACE